MALERGTELSALSRLDRAEAAIAADDKARHAEERAARARWHESEAREHAIRDAVNGYPSHEILHRREAELHRRAAALQDEAAERQRLHAKHMRQQR